MPSSPVRLLKMELHIRPLYRSISVFVFPTEQLLRHRDGTGVQWHVKGSYPIHPRTGLHVLPTNNCQFESPTDSLAPIVKIMMGCISRSQKQKGDVIAPPLGSYIKRRITLNLSER